MSRKHENILKRFWRSTGGGTINVLLLALAGICIVLLISIECWAGQQTGIEGESDADNIEASETEQVDDEDESGWISGLDEGDTSNMGNRINVSQLPDSSFIYDISIQELANADAYLDGQTVQVSGEVVGDSITSEANPKYCWITLQSQDPDDSEVAVYMSKNASKSIDTYGAFGKTGTTLQVRGTFNLASVDHEGVSEIEADSISVVYPGGDIEEMDDPRKMSGGLALILIGSLLMILFNIMRERQR